MRFMADFGDPEPIGRNLLDKFLKRIAQIGLDSLEVISKDFLNREN